MRPLTKGRFRLLLLCCWLVLFGLLLKRDVFLTDINPKELQALQQAESEEYQSIYFKNSKIGYVHNKFDRGADGTWLLNQQAFMRLKVAGTTQDIELQLKATISQENLLQDFFFSFSSPFYQMKARGRVEGDRVSYVLDTGSSVIEESMEFDLPPVLATSRRAYLLSGDMELGEKRRVPWFDPLSLTGRQSTIEYRGVESVLIAGRIHRLHHFIESFSGTRVNSWLNDTGIVIKEESPAGFVFIKEPKFKALNLADQSEDILSAVAVEVTGSMPPQLATLQSMAYRLQFPDSANFELDGGRQDYTDTILTVTREILPQSGSTQGCTKVGTNLDASPYIQSDDPRIVRLSAEITSGQDDHVAQVKQLGKWVYETLEKRPVLGLPDALSTLDSKRGDCNEHAALFAALARAGDIPTRIVAGVTYHQQAFYYHAWNEVCVGDQWVSIDTTTNQFPADLSHLRFVTGEMQEQVRIGGLLGNLEIAPLPPK